MGVVAQYFVAGTLTTLGIMILLCQIRLGMEAAENNRLLGLILKKLK